MDARLLEMLSQIAKGIASQFGPNCEVVVHEISEKSAYSSIVAIENGHVSGRKVGDGPSHVVLEQIGHDNDQVSDQLCYLTRTKDGKTLKSSSVRRASFSKPSPQSADLRRKIRKGWHRQTF